MQDIINQNKANENEIQNLKREKDQISHKFEVEKDEFMSQFEAERVQLKINYVEDKL